MDWPHLEGTYWLLQGKPWNGFPSANRKGNAQKTLVGDV